MINCGSKELLIYVNLKILNILNCNIKKGTLNLKNFKHLEELYCSNNEITEINNLSNKIKYLDCSFNKLKSFDIMHICSRYWLGNNELTQLNYGLNKQIYRYPKSLKELTINNNFNHPIINCPKNLTHLSKLTHIILKNCFDCDISYLSKLKCLTHLTIDASFLLYNCIIVYVLLVPNTLNVINCD